MICKATARQFRLSHGGHRSTPHSPYSTSSYSIAGEKGVAAVRHSASASAGRRRLMVLYGPAPPRPGSNLALTVPEGGSKMAAMLVEIVVPRTLVSDLQDFERDDSKFEPTDDPGMRFGIVEIAAILALVNG